MEAPPCWQWRTWRGRRDASEDHAMPPPSSSVVSRQSSAARPPVPVVPPVPEPVHAEQPTPRVVYEDGGGSAPWVRLVATDWSDGAASTYTVQAAHGSSWWAAGDGTLWVPATGEEWMAMFIALATAIDERTPHPAREPS